MKNSKRFIKKSICLLLCGAMTIFTIGCSKKQETQETKVVEDTKETQEAQETQTTEKDNTSTTAKPEITLKYADSQPAGYPSVVAAEEFAKLVSEKSGGRIEITIYPGGQLGDEKSNIEQLRFGALDFARVSIGPLSEFSPSLNVLQLPYLFRNYDHMWAVANGEIGQNFLASMTDAGLVGLSWFEAGSRCFYNAEREIKTLEDLKGLKIRVMESELMIDMAKSLGVNPTPMNSGEVYSSLQSGVIQGAENNIPTYVANAHNEVAKYYTIDEHIRMPEPMLMSKQVMDKLSEEDQAIIKEAAAEASDIQRELMLAYDGEARAQAEESGTIFTELSAEEKQKFQDACSPMYDKYAADYKDIVDAIINTK